MNGDAFHYLQAPGDGLWIWADADCITWNDGATICFRQEIAAILDRPEVPHAPPLSAMVLALAALRGKVPELEMVWSEPPGINGPQQEVHHRVVSELRKRVQKVLDQLQMIQRLPTWIKQHPGIKPALIELIAEGFDKPHTEKTLLIEALQEPLRETVSLNGKLAIEPSYLPIIHGLYQTLNGLSLEKLEARIAAGCDRIVEKPEEDIPAAVQQLIGTLLSDDETREIAQFARDLMAAIWLPRPISEPLEISAGGPADLSNRGTLDRLLLSELANDDDVLAVRVALNEALYLRREPPAAPQSGAFAILLDVGIRMWGMPRLFGIAASLALAARSSTKKGAAWIANGTDLIPMELTGREGVLRTMARLAPEPDPASALAEFFEKTAEMERPQRILVTHEVTVRDPEFRQALALHAPMLIATVNGLGEFRLLQSDQLNAKPLCAAKLNRRAVAETKTRESLKRGTPLEPMPAIYEQIPCPIALPIRGETTARAMLPNGWEAITTSSKRVYLLQEKMAGGCLISRDLQGRKPLLLEYAESVDRVILVASVLEEGMLQICSFSQNGTEMRRRKIRSHGLPSGVFILQNRLFLCHETHLAMFGLNTGECWGNIPLRPDTKWHRGRYFERNGNWLMLINEGLHWSMKILIAAPNDVKEVFDRATKEGPYVISPISGPWSLAEYLAMPRPVSHRSFENWMIRISRDGERVLRTSVVLSVETKQPTHGQLEPTVVPRHLQFRKGWTRIAITESGHLALLTRSKEWLALCPEPALLRLQLTISPPVFNREIEFVDLHDGFRLAEWPSGARAILDSDGLLHLQCAAPDFVEMSIGMHEGNAPFWLNAPQSPNPIAAMAENLQRFVLFALKS